MHLLAAQSGLVSDGKEPVDPEQDPADVIFVSAADTELACLSKANRQLGGRGDFLRLVQLSWLTNPYSVDTYLDKTATRSRLVIVRALGGLSYWQYCIEQMALRLGKSGTLFVPLPGDNNANPELLALASVRDDQWHKLHAYCIEGGPVNSGRLLRYCRHMLFGEALPLEPCPVPKAGIYWPTDLHADLSTVKRHWNPGNPVAAIVFYRALVIGGNLDPIDRLIHYAKSRGMNALPVFVSSLKDPESSLIVEEAFSLASPSIIFNATSFTASTPNASGNRRLPTVLEKQGKPILQVVLASSTEETWLGSSQGLPARDIAMNVALTEIDGKILTRAVAFKAQMEFDELTQFPVTCHKPVENRISFAADIAADWIRLSRTPPVDKRLGIILANYPNKDGRLANGVGLDTPESAVVTLKALVEAGYSLENVPATSSELMHRIQLGPTNRLVGRADKSFGEVIAADRYFEYFQELPVSIKNGIEDRWGRAEDDPFFERGYFKLSVARMGNIALGVQPARGYNIDPVDTYHSPDLVPPHNYLAFYFWLRHEFGVHAVIQLGKHGNLEWLPGKSLALSSECFPEVILGSTPCIYPFIVNDPGEGTQAKRRTQSVIIDHLTPPLTRSESYGEYRTLEVLLDEYHEAVQLDARRSKLLREKILNAMASNRLNTDIGIEKHEDSGSQMQKLDAYLCDLKESQIRDGLHVLGRSPSGNQERDLVSSLLRLPRNDGKNGGASLTVALAKDLELGEEFNPIDCDYAEHWAGPKPHLLKHLTNDAWRSTGDTVERLELLALDVIEGKSSPPGEASQRVLEFAELELRPLLESCGQNEIFSLLESLDGRFVPPGPSGAPSRGRLDVLPTGRNFYSVDARSIPTRVAWEIGWKSASLLVDRHMQDNGEWPQRMAVTAWGTSNMRTGGDDIAQVLALMGVRPVWSADSGRVTGFEIIPLSALGRPRVDVTLRISGFFRDAFPTQIDLVAGAARAIMILNEPEHLNPAAATFRRDSLEIGSDSAGYRVFGAMPGAYGAGLQTLIDERIWSSRHELGEAYLSWGSYAYGLGTSGKQDRQGFSMRLSKLDAIVQNQDNREHDILDSDDYYQFEGGMSAAVEALKGEKPTIYHNDHSRPERPVIRTLAEEIGRVVRSRAANPKWIEGVKRHGYKGAFEIAATVDYLFAFAATTGVVGSHHFDIIYRAYLEDGETREFIKDNNPAALVEIADRFIEAIDRGLWQPRSNSTRNLLNQLASNQENSINGRPNNGVRS